MESGDATKTAIEINNTSTGDPKINFQFGVSAPTFSIGIDNSDADKFKIGTSALETNTRLTINSSGYVGIGTSTPVGPLEVYSTTQNAKGISLSDGTSWISLVENLASGAYGSLSSNGDMGLIFSTDNNDAAAAANGLVIGPHSSGENGIKIMDGGKVGIGMTPSTNLLEVNGDASKTAAGDWLANSDARLKKDIKQMDSKAVLDKMLALKGITYYWNDTVTGSKRPTQLQYGFTAQNIQEVFPILVEEDNLGYLQTAYGTYDAMYVESMRALQQQIDAQQAIIEAQEREIDALKQNALKVAELENKMNAMLLLLNNKQELTVKQ